MVEILIVAGIVAVLAALLLPAVGMIRESSRETACASNLRQIAAATQAYLTAWRNHLPQVAVEVAPGDPRIIGALFGGKRGQLEAFGINEYGVDERPLNAYLTDVRAPHLAAPPDDTSNREVPVFESPVDRGQPANPEMWLEFTPSMYDYIGTSYTLNDHTLDGEDCSTLIPASTRTATGERPGGRMPSVDRPELTWMIGSIPIYNDQEGEDRGQRWAFNQFRVNLAFVDGHVGQGIEPPRGVHHTTRHYTFLPNPYWRCPDGSKPYDPAD